MTNFEFQTKAINSLVDESLSKLDTMATAFAKGRTDMVFRNNLLLQGPCGIGKTFVIANYLTRMLAKKPDTVFILLTPEKGGLSRQTATAIRFHSPSLSVIRLDGSTPLRNIETGDVTVLNWEKVVNKDKSGEYTNLLVRDRETNQSLFDMVARHRDAGHNVIFVIDEAHYGGSNKRSRISQFRAKMAEVLGYEPLTVEATATPVFDRNHYAGTIEMDRNAAVMAGLLREEVILNRNYTSRHALAKSNDDGWADADPKWLDNEDVLTAEVAYRTYVEIDEAVEHTPLMLLCIDDSKAGEEERADFEEWLSKSKGWTVENGQVAVYMSDDKTNIDNLPALDSKVRALIFKKGLAEGWDCPRAQVMVMTRHVTEDANIWTTQLLGRILRQPEQRAYDDELLDNGYIFVRESKDFQIPEDLKDQMRRGGSGGGEEDSSRARIVRNEALWNKVKDVPMVTRGYTQTFRSGGLTPKWAKEWLEGRKLPKVDPSLGDNASVAVFENVKLSGEAVDKVETNAHIEANNEEALHHFIHTFMRGIFNEKFGDHVELVEGEDAAEDEKSLPSYKSVKKVEGSVKSWLTKGLPDDDHLGLTVWANREAFRPVMERFAKECAAQVKSSGRNLTALTMSWDHEVPASYKVHRPSDYYDVGAHLGKRASELHLFGNGLAKGLTTAEKQFVRHMLRDDSGFEVVAWMRNPSTKSNFNLKESQNETAWAWTYRDENQPDGTRRDLNVFPDFIFWVKDSSGRIRPLVIEVKGEGCSSAEPTARIRNKATALLELTNGEAQQPNYSTMGTEQWSKKAERDASMWGDVIDPLGLVAVVAYPSKGDWYYHNGKDNLASHRSLDDWLAAKLG